MKILIYANGSCQNHGCEAINRATKKVLELTKDDLYIEYPVRGSKNLYHIDDIGSIIIGDYKGDINIIFKSVNKLWRVITKKNIFKKHFNNKELTSIFESVDYALSAGGDNYCYNDYELVTSKTMVGSKKCKLVLWGCSIEENVINNKKNRAEWEMYSLIVARESITFNNLKKLNMRNKVVLYPDCAFALDTIYKDFPNGFSTKNLVGLNISSLIMNYEVKRGIVIENYRKLIQYLIGQTDYNIVLIPHVVRPYASDEEVNNFIYEEFKDTNRICQIKDSNCMELKGYIARCRFFIGARTHATIAGYSSQIPTIAVGYSVKSRGIATDIFGTDQNYVLPVQQMVESDTLVKQFKWLESNEDKIKAHYQMFMPEYIGKLKGLKAELQRLI